VGVHHGVTEHGEISKLFFSVISGAPWWKFGTLSQPLRIPKQDIEPNQESSMKSFALAIFLIFSGLSGILLAQEAAIPEPEPRPVSLKQVVDMALKNNLDITIESFNPEISDTRITFEQSRFEPFLAATVNGRDATNPTGSILVGEQAINSNDFTYNFTLDHRLPTGTQYNVIFNNSRIKTTQSFTSVNPRFDSSLFANVTQPLMRGFGVDVTKAPLHIAEQNSFAADERLRVRVLDIALQVEQAYWDLVFFRRQRDVREQSLTSARDLYENNKKQVEVGTMAPLEIVVAEAEVAAREQDIILTENLIGNTEDRLRNLVSTERQKDRWDVQFVPSDEPIVAPITITTDEAIRRAFANNPDIKALEMDLSSNKLNKKLAQDGLKPQLDLQASVGFSGLGGDTLLLDDSTFPPTVIGVTPGGYPDALSSLFENRTWSLGFIVGLPIGNRAAEADFVRADLEEKQTESILQNAQQQLIFNIRTAMRNLQADLKRLQAAHASRILQEKKLDAERKKLAVGLSTNHIVLDYQDDLALAQSEEVFAMTDYQKNLAQLERYMGENLP
jgi:outer membrane protein